MPTENWFCIPVPITNNPFFDANYPMSINFGGLGSIIGHEISHAFDPSGSKYNYNGSQIEIWSNSSQEVYDSNVQCFIDFYDSIEVAPDVYKKKKHLKRTN